MDSSPRHIGIIKSQDKEKSATISKIRCSISNLGAPIPNFGANSVTMKLCIPESLGLCNCVTDRALQRNNCSKTIFCLIQETFMHAY